MSGKRLLAVFLMLLLCLGLCACGEKTKEEESGYYVITASDLHYLAPELTDHG